MADGSAYIGGAKFATSTVASSEGNNTSNVLKVQNVGADGASGSSTATTTSVDSAAASTSLLAANTSRKGATITNTDANVLYVDMSGGTASSTSYSVQVATGAYFEVPYGYTGAITGIWAADGAGAALVTEFS